MKIDDAPGLEVRKRAGKPAFYWIAKREARKAGYEPKTVRLYYPDTAEGHVQIAAKCRVLSAQMRQWLTGITPRAQIAKTGTFGWIVWRYQTDPDSPYHEVRASTRKSYDWYLAIIDRTIGSVKVSSADGPAIRKWFKEWARHDAETGEYKNPRRAYGCIQMMRILMSFGTALRNWECRDTMSILEHMQFPSVRHRKQRMTFEQCQLFRKTAHLMGHPMMALALSLQFELSLRQKDVIGEWVEGGVSGIVDGPDREVRRVIYRPRRAMSWQWGLTWSHIDENMILRKPTSKSNGELVSEHDLKRQPEVLAEMQHVPRDRRVGPMIINQSTGLPFKKREFSRLFRRIAVAAGLPKDLWNMDARAGAVTEAHEAGADLHDTMRMATHTEVQTNLIYSRSGVEQTSRVADLRMEFRKRANKTGTDGSNA